jgi:hypothetical protein
VNSLAPLHLKKSIYASDLLAQQLVSLEQGDASFTTRANFTTSNENHSLLALVNAARLAALGYFTVIGRILQPWLASTGQRVYRRNQSKYQFAMDTSGSVAAASLLML